MRSRTKQLQSPRPCPTKPCLQAQWWFLGQPGNPNCVERLRSFRCLSRRFKAWQVSPHSWVSKKAWQFRLRSLPLEPWKTECPRSAKGLGLKQEHGNLHTLLSSGTALKAHYLERSHDGLTGCQLLLTQCAGSHVSPGTNRHSFAKQLTTHTHTHTQRVDLHHSVAVRCRYMDANIVISVNGHIAIYLGLREVKIANNIVGCMLTPINKATWPTISCLSEGGKPENAFKHSQQMRPVRHQQRGWLQRQAK